MNTGNCKAFAFQANAITKEKASSYSISTLGDSISKILMIHWYEGSTSKLML